MGPNQGPDKIDIFVIHTAHTNSKYIIDKPLTAGLIKSYCSFGSAKELL